MKDLRASLVVPARNEDHLINSFLERVRECVHLPIEVLIIVDSEFDSTLNAIKFKGDSKLLIRFRCESITPFGFPVVPLVYIKQAHVPGFCFYII